MAQCSDLILVIIQGPLKTLGLPTTFEHVCVFIYFEFGWMNCLVHFFSFLFYLLILSFENVVTEGREEERV